jgi:uncharacterized membrane protein
LRRANKLQVGSVHIGYRAGEQVSKNSTSPIVFRFVASMKPPAPGRTIGFFTASAIVIATINGTGVFTS